MTFHFTLVVKHTIKKGMRYPSTPLFLLPEEIRAVELVKLFGLEKSAFYALARKHLKTGKTRKVADGNCRQPKMVVDTWFFIGLLNSIYLKHEIDGHKFCYHCRKMMPLDRWAKSPRGNTKTSYCHECYPKYLSSLPKSIRQSRTLNQERKKDPNYTPPSGYSWVNCSYCGDNHWNKSVAGVANVCSRECLKSINRKNNDSSLFKDEYDFQEHIDHLLKENGIAAIKEHKPEKQRGDRRVDFYLPILKVAIECKNKKNPIHLDTALGQTLVKSILLNARPYIAIPSDLKISEDFSKVCEALGVVICTEKNIMERLPNG